jgi:hypothetical protein
MIRRYAGFIPLLLISIFGGLGGWLAEVISADWEWAGIMLGSLVGVACSGVLLRREFGRDPRLQKRSDE